jgi:hypothetical protein
MEDVHWKILSLMGKNVKIYISNYVNLPNLGFMINYGIDALVMNVKLKITDFKIGYDPLNTSS